MKKNQKEKSRKKAPSIKYTDFILGNKDFTQFKHKERNQKCT